MQTTRDAHLVGGQAQVGSAVDEGAVEVEQHAADVTEHLRTQPAAGGLRAASMKLTLVSRDSR